MDSSFRKKMLYLILIQLFKSSLIVESLISIADPIKSATLIETQSGLIQGFNTETPDLKVVDTFLGIPYAQPPILELRFKRPEPVKPWSGIFNATSLPKTCPQKPFPLANVVPVIQKWSPKTALNEDCLMLNIWRLNENETENGTLKSVLVFIHGGGFTHGSTSVGVYDGSILAAETNTIVITMNYRIASFGFLYLDSDEAPGNQGLWDQRLALQWIRNNIEKFGGDPNSVTVFGHSAGAVSISHHLLSPESNGLFNRAVLLSGASTANWSYGESNDMLQMSLAVLNDIGCAKYNGSELDNLRSMECLRNASVDDIINSEPSNGFDDIFVFKPVIDGKFLKDNPKKLLLSGQFSKMDLIIGLVKNEGAIFLPGQLPYYFNVQSSPSLSYETFKESVSTVIGQEKGPALRAAVFEYTNFEEPENGSTNAKIIMEMMGDFYFTCTANLISQSYAETGSNVYKYLLVHRSEKSLWPKWMGATHSDDLIYIFGEPLRKTGNYSLNEIQLSKQFMQYLGAFSKQGNPNVPIGETNIGNIHWPKYTNIDKDYIILNENMTTNAKRYRERKCAFWNDYLPKLLKNE